MSVTQTQSNVPASVCNIAVGRYLSSDTAAAITITIGFKARYIEVWNVTAASTGLVCVKWFEGMAAASAIKMYDAGSSEAGLELITSLGITVSDKSFVIGLDTDLNVISEQLSWMAIG